MNKDKAMDTIGFLHEDPVSYKERGEKFAQIIFASALEQKDAVIAKLEAHNDELKARIKQLELSLVNFNDGHQKSNRFNPNPNKL